MVASAFDFNDFEIANRNEVLKVTPTSRNYSEADARLKNLKTVVVT
jgi:predicted cupin superfamily sugar epimerase